MLRVTPQGASSRFSFCVRWVMTGLVLNLMLTLVSCSSDEKKADNPEEAYALAQEYVKDDRYEEAIRRFNEVKSKYPYSKFATMAELAIADTYYTQESFPEAQVAYQNFKELHPKHPQIDYVTFRLGMSYFEQLPSSVDRDLALASSAMLYFDEVSHQFPNSEHAAEAKDKKNECLKKLASKEAYIADFYFKKEIYDSALARYEGLYRNYPDLGFDAKALSRSAICAQKTGDLERAKRYLGLLQKKFPGSSELASAKAEIR